MGKKTGRKAGNWIWERNKKEVLKISWLEVFFVFIDTNNCIYLNIGWQTKEKTALSFSAVLHWIHEQSFVLERKENCVSEHSVQSNDN